MNQRTMKIIALSSFITLTPCSAKANDIEDFFKSLRGGSGDHHESAAAIHQVGQHSRGAGRHGHGGQHHGQRPDLGMSTRDVYKQHQQFAEQHRSHYADGGNSYDLRHHHNDELHNSGHRNYGRHIDRDSRRSNWTFRVSAGVPLQFAQQNYNQQVIPQYPAVPQIPVMPQVPVVPQPMPVLHQVGEIVDCQVPLATCVRVEDACNIAPDAVPVVVAVHNPALPPHHDGCPDSVIFVEVCVPACPMQQLVISPCKTRIRMDFGHHQVDLKSKNGIVTIDYDN